MNATLQNGLTLAGRALLALLFIPAGYGKLTGFEGTVGYISSAGLPLPTVAAAIAVGVELLGGFALLAGFGTRLVAAVLALFTLAATISFHNFWALPADQAYVQQLMFYKNLAVIGGLLTVVAWGAGSWSVDARRSA